MIRDDPGERLVFLRPDNLTKVELMLAYGSLQPWHVYHETYAFCACRTAASFYRYRNGTHRLDDGSTMLLEPGEAHRNTRVYKQSDFKVLFIDPQAFEEAALELGLPGMPHFHNAVASDPRIYRAIYNLSAAIEIGDTQLTQQTRLADLTLSLFDFAERKPAPARGQGERRAITRAKNYLRDHYNQEVSLDSLAAVAGLSRFRLAHLFTQETGFPPHAFQIHIRIARARTLLMLGTPQASIAARLGFSDQSHFIRHFRRVMRVTPGEYLREC